MPTLSLLEHITYLETVRGLASKTIENYRYSAGQLGIDKIDTDQLPTLYATLSKALPATNPSPDGSRTYGYCYQLNGAISSLLAFNDITPKGAEYHEFIERLGKLKNIPDGYSEEQIRRLVRESMFAGYGFGLHRLLVFLTYTGCRISSANILLSKIEPVKGVDGVAYAMVTGKGRTYPAILPSKVAVYLIERDPRKTDRVSGWRPDLKTTFSGYNRSMLAGVIKSKGISKEITLNENQDGYTTIFHSFRKAFADRLANDEVESDNISLLLGQVPNTTAYKSYILRDGKKMENVLSRVAKAYAKTSFMELKIWE